MQNHTHTAGDRSFRWLLLPGRFPAINRTWHSSCTALKLDCAQIDLGNWHNPSLAKWVLRLDLAIARSDKPIFLVAHDVACFAACWWAAMAPKERTRQISGIILLAPPDLNGSDADPRFSSLPQVPCIPLPFPANVISSDNDPERPAALGQDLARRTGAQFFNAGAWDKLIGFLRTDSWQTKLKEMMAEASKKPAG